MKSTCVISVMASDGKLFVENLQITLSRAYETVQLLALGAEQDIAILKSRYIDIVCLEDLSFNYSADRLLLLSIDSFYELHTHITNFKRITLWFDPEFVCCRKELDFLGSVTTSNLVNTVPGAICARSEQGATDWKTTLNFEVPIANPIFDISLLQEGNEPLIESKGLPRYLIDGSTNLTNYALADSFIALQESDKEIDVWCLFSGQLKNWMKPDFKIDTIPTTELGIYLSSVDGVILAGDEINDISIANYLSLGKLPIIVDHKLENTITNLVDTAKIKESFPTFGTIELVRELLNNFSLIDEYNGLIPDVTNQNLYFTSSKIEKIFSDTANLECYLNSTQFDVARQEYNKGKYGDPSGSSFHKRKTENSRIIASIDSLVITEGRITGWALNTETESIARPIVLKKNVAMSCDLRRYDRADVDEYFNIAHLDNVGFEGIFFMTDALAFSDDLFYAVELSDHESTIIHTTVADLDTNYSEETFSVTGGTLVPNESNQGCLESISFVDAACFTLDDTFGKLKNCEFRIQHGDVYVSEEKIEVFLLIDENLSRLEKKPSDEYSFSFKNITNFPSEVKVIASSQQIDVSELKCIVSTTLTNYGITKDIENDIALDSDNVEFLNDGENSIADTAVPLKIAS